MSWNHVISPDKVECLREALDEGISVRAAGRRCLVTSNTARRYFRMFEAEYQSEIDDIYNPGACGITDAMLSAGEAAIHKWDRVLEKRELVVSVYRAMIAAKRVTQAMPKRIQRKRTKGWRMPDGAVYVGRGSVWGNPFIIGSSSGIFDGKDGRPLGLRDHPEILVDALSLDRCLEFYREMVQGYIIPEMFPFGHEWRREFSRSVGGVPAEMLRLILRGKDLACWCPLDQPCHADILLDLANK